MTGKSPKHPKQSKFYQQARDARTGEYTNLEKARKRPAVTVVTKRPRSRGRGA